jgi:FlaA1/EpsC-like NDP-sugar epimerase
MTIPEAAQLVLDAGALASSGEVFVLDMGEPVKIVDLANDLIRLSGLLPIKDIAIKYTGLRPGEKLFEEILSPKEARNFTKHQKIFVANMEKPDPLLREKVQKLLSLREAEEIVWALGSIVNDYHPNRETLAEKLTKGLVS